MKSNGANVLNVLSASMTPKLTLSFHDFGVIMTKGNVSYPVDPQEVQRILQAKGEAEAFSTGLIPRDTIYMYRKGRTSILIGYRPPTFTGLWLERQNARSDNPEVVRLMLPGLVMKRKQTGKSFSHSVWAVKEYPSPQTQLYYAPLPNIGHGGVCWGTVSLESVSENDLSEDWKILLGSVMNNHSIGNKSKAFEDVRDKLRAQQGQMEYDLDDLVSARSTVGELIKGVE